jgi:hypothetical protein
MLGAMDNNITNFLDGNLYIQTKQNKKMKLIKLLMAVSVTLTASFANAQSNNSINKVLSEYILLKDALVKTDGAVSASSAKTLLATVKEVNASELSSDTRNQWMKVVNDLKEDAEQISETKDIGNQRNHFISLSKNIYSVVKISKLETPIYYQFCPMANKGKGANWLSLENKIKNPYYGNQMLTCGKVVETIQ